LKLIVLKPLVRFLNDYYLDDIVGKDIDFFKNFGTEIDKLVGDFKFKIEDRLKNIFKGKER